MVEWKSLKLKQYIVKTVCVCVYVYKLEALLPEVESSG